jgi:DNA/RNA non-specific endonuclease
VARMRRGTRLLVLFWGVLLTVACLVLGGCEGVVVDVDGGGGTESRGPSKRAGSDEEDARAAERYGGVINYGHVDRATGQRSGITATITAEMIKAAERDALGSEPRSSIRPPGFDKLPQRNRARGHLLGRQLGGSGDVASNLVALYQRAANSPVMRDYETLVANAAEAGETVEYEVRPIYDGKSDRGAPKSIRIIASGDRGLRLDVEIANTPEADVKEYAAPK